MKTTLIIMMFLAIGIVQAQKPKTKVIPVEVPLIEKVDSIDTEVLWRDSTTFQVFMTDGESVIDGIGYWRGRQWKWDTIHHTTNRVEIDGELIEYDPDHIWSIRMKKK